MNRIDPNRYRERARPVKARGGLSLIKGPGSGRSDDIEALLSDGEYVIDAESVALLGDGSLDEGSRKLDEMRQNLRRHKGKNLSRGEFSHKAKTPEAYMAKGGRAKKKYAKGGKAVQALRELANRIKAEVLGDNKTMTERVTQDQIRNPRFVSEEQRRAELEDMARVLERLNPKSPVLRNWRSAQALDEARTRRGKE